MTKTQYTTGPFVAEQSEQGHFEVLAPNAPKTRRRIARCGGPDREANAHLIAAAPDMYEALKAFALTFADMEDGNGNEAPELAPARAAIAKAEGRS